jgi:hypothetical protein
MDDDNFDGQSVRRFVRSKRPVNADVTRLLDRMGVEGSLNTGSLTPEELALMHVLVARGQARLEGGRYVPPLLG